MMGAEVALSSRSRLPEVLPAFSGSDKLQHAAWFFLLALLAWRAGREGEGWGRGRRTATLLVVSALWAASDEWHQSFVPGRAVEAGDLVADVAGASLALAASELLLRWRESRRANP